MKINAQHTNKPLFNPVKLELEFESQDELDKWTALFNDNRLGRFLCGNPDKLWSVLHEVGGNAYQFEKELEDVRKKRSH